MKNRHYKSYFHEFKVMQSKTWKKVVHERGNPGFPDLPTAFLFNLNAPLPGRGPRTSAVLLKSSFSGESWKYIVSIPESLMSSMLSPFWLAAIAGTRKEKKY